MCENLNCLLPDFHYKTSSDSEKSCKLGRTIIMILIIVMKTGGLKKRQKTGGPGRKVASFNVNRSNQLGVNYTPFAF